MKLYKISQNVNHAHDSYDSAVVAAPNEEAAKRISPEGYYEVGEDDNFYFIDADGTKENKGAEPPWSTWCKIEDVRVEYLGEAKEGTKKGVIVSSFNAG